MAPVNRDLRQISNMKYFLSPKIGQSETTITVSQTYIICPTFVKSHVYIKGPAGSSENLL